MAPGVGTCKKTGDLMRPSSPRFASAVVFVLATSCGGSGSAPESVEGQGTDAGLGADGAADSAVDATFPADATTTDAADARPAPRPLRFVAIGDTGTGSADQKKVADAIKAKCDASGCDFVQLLGDNFYESGVSSATDPQFATKFEQPYAAVDLPFWVVLGNHDYGGNGAGTEFGKPDFQVAYAQTSAKYKLPARYWHRTDRDIEFFGLDTNEMMFDRAGTQRSAVTQWISGSTARWKIALGHHPYLSNGPHGNAGRYEGIPLVPVVSGVAVKSFFDDVVCGKVDVYLCGHDHSRQYLQGKCGQTTELIVSGAGAKVTDLTGSNPVHYQANTIGFVYITVDANTFTAEFIDSNGRSEFTRTIRK